MNLNLEDAFQYILGEDKYSLIPLMQIPRADKFTGLREYVGRRQGLGLGWGVGI